MTAKRELLLATRNPGKIAEYRELLEGIPYAMRTTRALAHAPEEPPEEADTYVENAAAKALAYARATGMLSFADDSGLEVDALGGAPGVRTRRYFGDELTDAERNERLLDVLRGSRDRGARFVCLIALAWPDGTVETFRGESQGTIAPAPRGAHGFGYDPVFVADGEDQTNAELPPARKHRISHRGRAAMKLVARLHELAVLP